MSSKPNEARYVPPVTQHTRQQPPPEEEEEPPMSPADKQYAKQVNIPRRIHILGTGSIGKLVAHALRGIKDPPPVTLLLHRYRLLRAWEKSRKVVRCQDGDNVIPRSGYDVELVPEIRHQHGVNVPEGGPDIYELADQTNTKPHEAAQIVAQQQAEARKQQEEEEAAQKSKLSEGTEEEGPQKSKSRPGDYAISSEPIHNLIITTKTVRTVAALRGLRHRIGKDTTICILQNGMGVIDEINEQIFPNEATRPTYLQGIVSHGANVPPEKALQDPFFVVHAGHGTIALGAVPKNGFPRSRSRPPTPTGPTTSVDGKLSDDEVQELPPSGRYIVRTLCRTPVLACVAFTPIEILQLQLEKLAINSIMNPLTALIDSRNGALLYNFHLNKTMRLMLAETSLIIRSLPELQGIPTVPWRFTAERLETLVVSVSDKTKNNISSMLADMRGGRKTEIDYINGYIIKRGEEQGIKAVVNFAIMNVVIGKGSVVQKESSDEVPFARPLNES